MVDKQLLFRDRQLTSASTDSSEWISKYQKVEEARSLAVSDKERVEKDLRAQLSQAEQRLSQAQSKLLQAEQQAKDAEASLTRDRQHFEQRLQEAQSQVQAAPQATASAAPGEHAFDALRLYISKAKVMYKCQIWESSRKPQ